MAKTVQKSISWERIPLEQYGQKDVIRIITFFVFHSPCPGVSAQGKTLAEYGWHNSRNSPYYLNKQLKKVATELSLFVPVGIRGNMETILQNNGCDKEFPPNSSMEAALFYDSDRNQFLSLFRHIRNAFAHGLVRFGKVGRETAFILEDVKINKAKKERIVTARIVLRKSTLLKWIDIIEAGEKEYTKT